MCVFIRISTTAELWIRLVYISCSHQWSNQPKIWYRMWQMVTQSLQRLTTSFSQALISQFLNVHSFTKAISFCVHIHAQTQLRAGSFVTRVFPEFRNSVAENSPYTIVPVSTCMCHLSHFLFKYGSTNYSHSIDFKNDFCIYACK